MVLQFKGMMMFRYWEKVCVRVAELLEDVKGQSAPFAPSLESLLDVLLCPRDPTTGFFNKACCYGECEGCGWNELVGDLKVSDSVQDDEKSDPTDVCVKFQAFENVRTEDHVTVADGKDFDFTAKTATRPTLSSQKLSPSSFMHLFISSLAAYTKHKYCFCSFISHLGVQVHRSISDVHGAQVQGLA
jgi:uncharacterized protein (DUF2237 family)